MISLLVVVMIRNGYQQHCEIIEFYLDFYDDLMDLKQSTIHKDINMCMHKSKL